MNPVYKKLFLIQGAACIAETSTYPIDYIKTRIQEFEYMEKISTLSDFKIFIKTSDFWADTWSISA